MPRCFIFIYYRIDRTTNGTGLVADLPYHNGISNIRTKEGDQPVPLLKDLLDVLLNPPYHQCDVILDIKEDNPIAILDKLHKLLLTCNFHPKRIILGVWNLAFLLEAKRLFSDNHEIMLIHEHWPPRSTPSLPIPEDSLTSNMIDIFSIDWDALKDASFSAIRRIHETHKVLFVWVLNSIVDFKAAKFLEIDAVITDRPDLFQAD